MSGNIQHTYGNGRTVMDYMEGCASGISLPESTFENIAERRGVFIQDAVADLDKRMKDLLMADVYVQISLLPSVSASVEDAHGTWKHKEGSTQLSESDKKRYLDYANSIFASYGEKTVSRSGIKMNCLGMRIWRRK